MIKLGEPIYFFELLGEWATTVPGTFAASSPNTCVENKTDKIKTGRIPYAKFRKAFNRNKSLIFIIAKFDKKKGKLLIIIGAVSKVMTGNKLNADDAD